MLVEGLQLSLLNTVMHIWATVWGNFSWVAKSPDFLCKKHESMSTHYPQEIPLVLGNPPCCLQPNSKEVKNLKGRQFLGKPWTNRACSHAKQGVSQGIELPVYNFSIQKRHRMLASEQLNGSKWHLILFSERRLLVLYYCNQSTNSSISHCIWNTDAGYCNNAYSTVPRHYGIPTYWTLFIWKIFNRNESSCWQLSFGFIL